MLYSWWSSVRGRGGGWPTVWFLRQRNDVGRGKDTPQKKMY